MMVKMPKGWTKTRDARFPQNILFISPDEFTTLEVSPNWSPPFKKKTPDEWMFSVWKGNRIIRKHNKIFKKKGWRVARISTARYMLSIVWAMLTNMQPYSP